MKCKIAGGYKTVDDLSRFNQQDNKELKQISLKPTPFMLNSILF